MVEKLGKNLIAIAVIIAGVLIAGAIVFVSQKKITSPEVLSPQQAAEKAINFINQNQSMFGLQGVTVSLVDAVEENGVYKFRLKIGENEFESYVTKNGKLLFIGGIDLEEAPIVQAPETETPQSPSESAISPEELTKFIGCLKGANFVIYGANWCGWTSQLVQMLGGWEMVKPVYVECTEDIQLCQEKGIGGYPTILIQEEQYQGARTFEEFSGVTGCQMPEGAESIIENPSAGGCQ